MSRHDRFLLFVLTAPVALTAIVLGLLFGATLLLGRAPPLSDFVPLGIYVFAAAQIALAIWYYRIRNDL